jgi:hypothetical protein
MNSMEIIALVLSIITLLKILLFLFNPKWLPRIVDGMYNYITFFTILISAFVLALGTYLVLYMGPVMLMVASLFGMMTIALVLLMYPKQYLKFAKVILNEKKRLIPVFVVWGVLAVLTLWKLFG